MALTDENNMVMPVAPMYGGSGGFGNALGGDGWWIILLFILLGGWGNNGWGNGYGGVGGFAADGAMLYPWMNQAEITNNGFRDQMINGNIMDIRDGISGLSTQLCNSTSGIQMSLANGFAGVEQGANTRQIANMQQAFAAQTAMNQGFNGLSSQFADCCCENRLGIADLKYTVATENCADRYEAAQNARDIIDSQTRGTQAILDKLCQLELDGVKGQLDNANNTINQLRTQLLVSNNEASQTAQTAAILAGQTAEVDALYNRLSSCPVPAVPVYGRQPVFNCNNDGGCGCGSF